MKKTPDQIERDRLESNSRKASVRSDNAVGALDRAKKAIDAETKRGKNEIRKRQLAVDKAARSAAQHSNARIKFEIGFDDDTPRERRLM